MQHVYGRVPAQYVVLWMTLAKYEAFAMSDDERLSVRSNQLDHSRRQSSGRQLDGHQGPITWMAGSSDDWWGDGLALSSYLIFSVQAPPVVIGP